MNQWMARAKQNFRSSFFLKRYLPHLVLLLVSAVLIFNKLNIPQALVFDETYHIPSAQKYLNGVFFQENHPPLGKLLIAFGEWLSSGKTRPDFIEVDKIEQDWPKDFDLTGFRLAPAFFGSFVPLIFFVLLKTLTRRTSLAWLMALLLCFETAFLMQARIAMLDVFLLFFILLALLFFARGVMAEGPVPWLELALFGVVSGCAANIKSTGLIVLVPFGILVLKSIKEKPFVKTVRWVSIFVAVFAVSYFGWWLLHFSIARKIVQDRTYQISAEHQAILTGKVKAQNPLQEFYLEMSDAFTFSKNYNAGVPALKLGIPTEVGSPWYEWLLGGRAINYRWETLEGIYYRYSYLVPNPVTWMVSLLGVIFGSALVLSDFFFRFLKPDKSRTLLWAFVAIYWCYLSPFWFIQRVMYLYHYLPAMLIGMSLFAICLRLLSFQTSRKLIFVCGLVLLAGLVFLLLRPFIYYEPLTNAEFQFRNFWPFWKLLCVKCG